MTSAGERTTTRRERSALDSFDSSLANLTEPLVALLDAAEADFVVEVGAEHGHLVSELLARAEQRQCSGGRRGAGAWLTAIDPEPQARLLEVAAGAGPAFELVRAPSLEALRECALGDAVILDGDHNHYTLLSELRLIGERAPGSRLPLLLLHDIGWPLARRDSYHDPEQIPPEHRHELARDVFLTPGDADVGDRGLPAGCVAAHEGGPANGILTAAEDFVAERDGLRLATVPPFFGLGVIWHREAPWAEAVAATVGPWDRDPLLRRLEESRVDHLVAQFANAADSRALRSRGYERDRLLEAMLESSAFVWAERISRLRQRGEPLFSRERIARALGRPSSGPPDGR